MENFFLEVAKIIGNPSGSSWSQIHEFIPADDQKLLKRGRLVVGASVFSQENKDLVAEGKKIISRIEEFYYGFLENSSVDQLEKTLQLIDDEFSPIKLEIELLAILGNACFLATLGKGEIFLKRQSKAALLLKGVEGEILSTSGFLKDEDVFLLSSSKAIEIIGEKKLFSSIMKPSIVESSDFLLPIVHAQEEDGLSLVALVGISENKELKETVNFEKIDKPAISLSENNSEQIEKVKKPSFLKQKLESLNLLGFKGALRFRAKRSKQTFSQVSGGIFGKLKDRFNKRAIYLQSNKKSFKRTYITVAFVLGLMLLVSVILGSTRERGSIALKTTSKESVSVAKTKIDEAEALLSLNPLKSKEILLEAKSLLEQVNDEKYNEQSQELLAKLEPLLAKVSKEYNGQISELIDLELIKDQAKATDVVLAQGELYILDSGKQSIYTLDSQTLKNSFAASGDYLSSAEQIALSTNAIFCFNDEGIIRIDKKSKQKTVVSNIEDQPFQAVKDMAYFGQSIYVLTDNQIYKYPILDDLLGSGKPWLDESLSFSAKRIAIDGSIWLLGSNLKLFTRGEEENFSLSGFDKQIDLTSMYTDESLDLVLLLDNKNRKVIALKKSGEYDSQYSFSLEDNLRGILVSKELKKIYLFSETKIYQMDLQD